MYYGRSKNQTDTRKLDWYMLRLGVFLCYWEIDEETIAIRMILYFLTEYQYTFVLV